MPRSWIPATEELSDAALTVRAQTVSPDDNGALRWNFFFPRRNVNSVKLEDVTTLDYRPTADRREWNAPGRLIPYRTPSRRKVEIVPINPYRKWGESEMQELAERTLGNEGLMLEIIGNEIEPSVDEMAASVYRRIEVDAMSAWALGLITQKNPQSGETYTASFGFDAGRMQTAGTAWNDGSMNAYNEFVAWVKDGRQAIGSAGGVMLKQIHVNAIMADAPNPVGTYPMTLTQVEQRITDELGSAFMFVVNEDTVHTFNDGGTAYSDYEVWPQRMALIPRGNTVGTTAFAPVVRAMDLARQVPQAKIDIRGVTVFYDEANAGRELKVEEQANALSVPDEQRLWVINPGF